MSENMVNLTPEYIGIVSALVLNSQKNAMEQAKQYQVIRDNIRQMESTAKNPILKMAISIYCGSDMDDDFIMSHPYEAAKNILRSIQVFDLIKGSILNKNGALNRFFGSLSVDNCYMAVSDIYASNVSTIACMDALIQMAQEMKDDVCSDFLVNLKNSFFRDINKLGECMALSGVTPEELGARCGALVHLDELRGYTNYPDNTMSSEDKSAAANDSVLTAFANVCTVTQYVQRAYWNLQNQTTPSASSNTDSSESNHSTADEISNYSLDDEISMIDKVIDGN